LPRYGLGNYVKSKVEPKPSAAEQKMIDNLGRAGTRLMGFCRTNLFKRLESSGSAFLQSVERHILRNFIFLHAIENGLDLPIGTQDAALLDTRFFDDEDSQTALELDGDSIDTGAEPAAQEPTEAALRTAAVRAYRSYQTLGAKRFKWLSPRLFKTDLASALLADANLLLQVLTLAGHWEAGKDAKLQALGAGNFQGYTLKICQNLVEKESRRQKEEEGASKDRVEYFTKMMEANKKRAEQMEAGNAEIGITNEGEAQGAAVLTPLETLVQAIIFSNEFAFVN